MGVIGAGFVGGALIRAFAQYTDIKVYDTGKDIGTFEDVMKQDVIFVCLPSPMKKSGECDTSIIEKTLFEIDKHLYHPRPVIVKSTVPPTWFEEMQDRLYHADLGYMPEFLTERTADIDFINSSRFILGVSRGSIIGEEVTIGFGDVVELFQSRFPGTRLSVMTWEEASLVKYATNNFFTVKLSFFNEVYNLAEMLDAEPEKVIEEILQDGRIGRSHFQVPGHDGDFGWGGHCFPKDNRAYSYFAKEALSTSTMVDAAWEVNERVRENRDWEKQKGRAVSDD